MDVYLVLSNFAHLLPVMVFLSFLTDNSLFGHMCKCLLVIPLQV